jgi:hypothetical protein
VIHSFARIRHFTQAGVGTACFSLIAGLAIIHAAAIFGGQLLSPPSFITRICESDDAFPACIACRTHECSKGNRELCIDYQSNWPCEVNFEPCLAQFHRQICWGQANANAVLIVSSIWQHATNGYQLLTDDNKQTANCSVNRSVTNPVPVSGRTNAYRGISTSHTLCHAS